MRLAHHIVAGFIVAGLTPMAFGICVNKFAPPLVSENIAEPVVKPSKHNVDDTLISPRHHIEEFLAAATSKGNVMLLDLKAPVTVEVRFGKNPEHTVEALRRFDVLVQEEDSESLWLSTDTYTLIDIMVELVPTSFYQTSGFQEDHFLIDLP